jgi:hypothetical protein
MTKLAPLLLVALAGCPDDADKNGETLWLAPNGSEIELQLVESEPPEF